MSKQISVIFRLNEVEKDLFDFYCSIEGKAVSGRLRELVVDDIDRAREIVLAMPDGSSKYIDRLKQSIESGK